MLNYLWSRFTTAETQRDLVKVPPRPYFVQLRDGLRVMVCGAVANEIEALKRDLAHKTDLAESYKGATERRDERIAELERQNNEYILQYAMQSDSVAVLEKQLADANRKLSAIEAIFSVNLSPKGDKTDDDTAEFTSPKMIDSGKYGE